MTRIPGVLPDKIQIWSDVGIIICTAIIITTQPDLLKHDFIKSGLKHQTCVYFFILKGKV